MHKRGFTLIELLVVIAIIGILATIVTTNLVGSKAKSRDGKRVADIKTIQLALELYYNDNSKFPKHLTELVPTYLPVLPKDPSDNSTAYKYAVYNAAQSVNCNPANPPIRYHLAAVMESDSEGFSDNPNPALKQDADYDPSNSPCDDGDVTSAFNGKTFDPACGIDTIQENDSCYDWTN